MSRSAKRASGLKDKALEHKPLFGAVSEDWKDIFSPYNTLFVLKTGGGDEIDWLQKVVFDNGLETKIVDLGRLAQFFLPNIKEYYTSSTLS